MRATLRWIYDAEWARYLAVGLTVTFVGTLLLTGLLYLMAYPLAYTIVFVLSILFNAMMQSRFVFRTPLLSRLHFIGLGVVVQYFIGLGCLSILLDGFHLDKAIAPTINLFICTPVNFLISRFAFKGRRKPIHEDDHVRDTLQTP